MMITAETLTKIAETAAAMMNRRFGLDGDALDEMKVSWPELRFTLCSDEDMPARMPAALQREQFNLYMVGGGEHCLSLTTDHEQAIGVVIALVDD